MLDHKLDPIIIGEQVGVLAADGKFYHHAIVTKHDSEKKKTMVDYIGSESVTGKKDETMVKLNNLKTIKTLDKVKKFKFGSVVECMDTNLPDLPVTLTKPLGKKRKE